MSTTGGKKSSKNTNIWRLNNTPLNNKSQKKSKKEIKMCIEMNENENLCSPKDDIKKVKRENEKYLMLTYVIRV